VAVRDKNVIYFHQLSGWQPGKISQVKKNSGFFVPYLQVDGRVPKGIINQLWKKERGHVVVICAELLAVGDLFLNCVYEKQKNYATMKN